MAATISMMIQYCQKKDTINIYLSANNSPSQDGTTPLFVASQNGHTGTVNILLANGADVNIRGFKV